MQYKKISPEIKLKIINLSKCFWFWSSFYGFYAQILELSKRKLELRFPKENYNKYQVSEIILDELEEKGELGKIREIVHTFYNLKKPFDGDDNPKQKEAEKDLREFRSLVGEDLVSQEVENREFEKNLAEKLKNNLLDKERSKNIENIKNTFFEYSMEANGMTNQNRGFWLEKAFYSLLELEQITHKKSYRTNTEQIDGHFNFDKFDYLVEIKWINKPLSQEEISIFEGKLSTKGQSTRGFVLSISGFDDGAVKKATTTPPKIIFMDAVEFISILESRNSFFDLFTSKVDSFVRLGKVYR